MDSGSSLRPSESVCGQWLSSQTEDRTGRGRDRDSTRRTLCYSRVDNVVLSGCTHAACPTDVVLSLLLWDTFRFHVYRTGAVLGETAMSDTPPSPGREGCEKSKRMGEIACPMNEWLRATRETNGRTDGTRAQVMVRRHTRDCGMRVRGPTSAAAKRRVRRTGE